MYKRFVDVNGGELIVCGGKGRGLGVSIRESRWDRGRRGVLTDWDVCCLVRLLREAFSLDGEAGKAPSGEQGDGDV